MLCLAFSTGCGRSSAPHEVAATASPADSIEEDSIAADSIVALIGRVDRQTMREAFSRLSTLSYTRTVRNEQCGGAGDLIAHVERIIRIGPNGTHIVSADSSGAFDYGYLSRFVSSSGHAASSANLIDYIVPDDPAYASRRTMEAYQYSIRDTTLSDRPVQMIHIRVRPHFEEDQSIRAARLYLDASTERMVAYYVDRTDHALWFEEESVLFVRIARMSSGLWVPAETRFYTRLDAPLRPIQRFTTRTFYTDFGPSGDG